MVPRRGFSGLSGGAVSSSPDCMMSPWSTRTFDPEMFNPQPSQRPACGSAQPFPSRFKAGCTPAGAHIPDTLRRALTKRLRKRALDKLLGSGRFRIVARDRTCPYTCYILRATCAGCTTRRPTPPRNPLSLQLINGIHEAFRWAHRQGTPRCAARDGKPWHPSL